MTSSQPDAPDLATPVPPGRTRVGLVGAGSVGRRHAAVLAGFGDVELAGVTDPDGDAADALAREARITAYPGLDPLLDDAAPDAVYVCVPPFAHGAPERRLLERGIPFFVEKPVAVDLDTAEELAAAVADAGLLTATGYHWRYLDGVERARERLRDSPVRLALAAWLDRVPPVGWWTRRDRSGGQVIEQATHVLDVLLDLVGEIEEVHAVGSHAARPAFPEADVDDVTVATVRFAGGAVGTLAATSLLSGRHRAGVELFWDGGRLELSETELVIDAGGGPVTYVDSGAAKRRVDRAFVDAVQGRADDVRAPYAVALRTHRIACAMARSARHGVPVARPASA